MKLIYCGECGVVLNQDAILFPPTHDDNHKVIEANVVWTNDYSCVAKTNCPVCKGIIVKEE